MPSIRDYITCWIRERLRTEFILRPWMAARFGLTWRDICNRIDDLRTGPDDISKFVNAPDSSYLKAAQLFPAVGGRILRQAMIEYPFRLQSISTTQGAASPEISVIIPFVGTDRLTQLQTVLDGFYAQDHTSFEVILVQGSPAETNPLKLTSFVRSIYLPEPPGGRFNKSRLFNAGVRESRAPYMLLHDADILVPHNFVKTCHSLLKQGWEAFCPIRFLFYLSTKQTAELMSLPEAETLPGEIAEIRQNFAGGSVAISRAAFDDIGGFDESFEGWGGEDVEFLHRARRKHFLSGSLMPALHLWHPPAAGKNQQHPNLRKATLQCAAASSNGGCS